MLRLALLLIALATSTGAQARPSFFVPALPDAVIERLPRGFAQLQPDAPAPPAQRAQRLLAAATRSGDARLAARAEALLPAVPADSVEGLRLRAFAAQHRHHFVASARFLDRLLQRQPRDADALLARAQLHIVAGRLDLARADCTTLALGVDAGNGLLCAAALGLRQNKADVAALLVDRWLASSAAAHPARPYALLLRADAASRAGAADATSWYRRALAPRPDDVRVLAAYARHLRSAERPDDVLVLLAAAPRTDTLELERALAAKAARSPDGRALTDALTRRYAMARRLGAPTELRELAEYELALRGDPIRALALAQRNFASQRDHEDAELLRRAARAARRPEVLAQVESWSRSQGIVSGVLR